jgi:hypothetical protein
MLKIRGKFIRLISVNSPILAQQDEYSFIKKWGSEGIGFGQFA